LHIATGVTAKQAIRLRCGKRAKILTKKPATGAGFLDRSSALG
jgi:hypothetical protein